MPNNIISTHAPVKGATLLPQPVDFANRISIHAPVKGATRKTIQLIDDDVLISIHAPVKGATTDRYYHRRLFPDFNPRTREGCDHEVVR